MAPVTELKLGTWIISNDNHLQFWFRRWMLGSNNMVGQNWKRDKGRFCCRLIAWGRVSIPLRMPPLCLHGENTGHLHEGADFYTLPEQREPSRHHKSDLEVINFSTFCSTLAFLSLHSQSKAQGRAEVLNPSSSTRENWLKFLTSELSFSLNVDHDQESAFSSFLYKVSFSARGMLGTGWPTHLAFPNTSQSLQWESCVLGIDLLPGRLDRQSEGRSVGTD